MSPYKDMNKYIKAEGSKFLFTVQCQLVNAEEVMKTENALSKNPQSGGELSQEPSKDSKAGGQRFKEVKGKCVGLENSPT